MIFSKNKKSLIHTVQSTASSAPVMSVEGVSFSYGDAGPVLKDICFQVMKGDFLGLVGPNGGGKSTLLKLMLGILPLQKGSVRLFGEEISKFRHWPLVGYVSQKATDFDKRFPATVREVVSMGRVSSKGLLRPLDESDEAIVEEALKDTDMFSKKDSLISALSGGQQQRVFISRALASQPRLLILDEPTVGIDLPSQEQFYLLLQRLRKEKHLTIILVSHDIDVVATQANSFACLNQSLIYHGVPENFITQDYMEKLYGKNLRYVLHGH